MAPIKALEGIQGWEGGKEGRREGGVGGIKVLEGDQLRVASPRCPSRGTDRITRPVQPSGRR